MVSSNDHGQVILPIRYEIQVTHRHGFAADTEVCSALGHTTNDIGAEALFDIGLDEWVFQHER
ncbi:hypothetical protein D3C75_1307870 [compost metagenome]